MTFRSTWVEIFWTIHTPTINREWSLNLRTAVINYYTIKIKIELIRIPASLFWKQWQKIFVAVIFNFIPIIRKIEEIAPKGTAAVVPSFFLENETILRWLVYSQCNIIIVSSADSHHELKGVCLRNMLDQLDITVPHRTPNNNYPTIV